MTTTVDPHLGARWRSLAFILRGEKRVQTEALAALMALAAYTRDTLAVSGMDPQVLDSRAAPWRNALETGVVPAVTDLFTAAWDATARAAIDVTPYATRHIESVWNRMVGVADTEFDAIRLVLEEGRAAGESIPQLARRVNAHLSDTQRWKGRALTVARTEVIGANNMGSHGAARASAAYLGVDPTQVAKRWLATEDARTRPTHQTADGQTVIGLDTPFSVGGAHMLVPGDPSGPAKEVINCRCTPTYSYPGDSDYPTDAPGAAAQGEPFPDLPPDPRQSAATGGGDLLTWASTGPTGAQAAQTWAEGYLTPKLPAGLSAKVKTASSGGDQMTMNIGIHDTDGQLIAEAFREVQADRAAVYNSRFVVQKDYQGQGISTAINNALEDAYAEAGIKTLELHANYDVGGYAWAMRGYDFATMDDLYRTLKHVRVRARNYPELRAATDGWLARVESGDFPREDWPTPYELASWGREPGDTTWPGREAMLDSDWNGVRQLAGVTP